jgi:hypothetical protein
MVACLVSARGAIVGLMSTFDEILAAHPTAVAAWDLELGPEETLSIFDTAAGARRVAEASYPRSERADVTLRLELRGVPVGAHDLRGGVLWVATRDAFSLWSASERTLKVSDATFELADGRILSRPAEVEVRAEIDAEGTCAVFLSAGDEVHTIAAVDMEDAEGADGAEFVDAQWARALGRALAAWCGARFVDRT